MNYTLKARKRGYYDVGPLFLSGGDVLGLAGENRRRGEPDALIVLPRIFALSRVPLKSRTPLGSLPHHMPIFEDPARIIGKRFYQSGDSLRRVDWKTSAATGHLQVKQFEPSITAEITLALNLNRADYHHRRRLEATEFAIEVAASIANWAIGHKLPTGLMVYGSDPLAEDKMAAPISAHKGSAQLSRILELLARVQVRDLESFQDELGRQIPHLAWGATLLIISGSASLPLFQLLQQARRTGVNPALVLCGPVADVREVRQLAQHFHIPLTHFQNETGLQAWQ